MRSDCFGNLDTCKEEQEYLIVGTSSSAGRPVMCLLLHGFCCMSFVLALSKLVMIYCVFSRSEFKILARNLLFLSLTTKSLSSGNTCLVAP